MCAIALLMDRVHCCLTDGRMVQLPDCVFDGLSVCWDCWLHWPTVCVLVCLGVAVLLLLLLRVPCVSVLMLCVLSVLCELVCVLGCVLVSVLLWSVC